MKVSTAATALLFAFSSITSAFPSTYQNGPSLNQREALLEVDDVKTRDLAHEYRRRFLADLDIIDKREADIYERNSLSHADIAERYPGPAPPAAASAPTKEYQFLRGLAHVDPTVGQQYAVKESCSNPSQGVHCRLVVGRVTKSSAGQLNWQANYYDIIKNQRNPKVADPREKLWTVAIGGSKYNPQYLGVAHGDPRAAQMRIMSANPGYCLLGPIPGIQRGNNCFSFVDELWSKLK